MIGAAYESSFPFSFIHPLVVSYLQRKVRTLPTPLFKSAPSTGVKCRAHRCATSDPDAPSRLDQRAPGRAHTQHRPQLRRQLSFVLGFIGQQIELPAAGLNGAAYRQEKRDTAWMQALRHVQASAGLVGNHLVVPDHRVKRRDGFAVGAQDKDLQSALCSQTVHDPIGKKSAKRGELKIPGAFFPAQRSSWSRTRFCLPFSKEATEETHSSSVVPATIRRTP
jgi:hypothetical protein